MNENNETETEAPTKEELATRVEQLEATVEKMIPTRREALGMGASAVAAGGLSQLLFGEAKAGSQQSGTIGSQSNVQDWYVEDLYDHNGNQPLSLPGNGRTQTPSPMTRPRAEAQIAVTHSNRVDHNE